MLKRQRIDDEAGLPRDRGAPVSYVALGDSTVYGMGASRPERSYVGLVGARLRAIYPRASTANLGVNGATAADVVTRQLAAAVARRPQLVTLSVGPNDIIQGRGPQQFERDLATIFRRLDDETDAAVVANLLPDLAALPLLPPELRAVAGALTASFNLALREAAAARQVTVVDLYEASRRVVPANPGLLSSDYFHPSDEGYARWAELMWGGIEPAIPAA
jgi:lysophospholipase L1-like esterase